MLLDRARQILGIPFGLRVVAPHDALQLGKLTDHGRQQIGLREVGRGRDVRARADLVSDGHRQGFDACGLVRITAELCLERHSLELGGTLLERHLAVLIPEKGGIPQTRTHHALIALAHLVGIAALDVAHRHEAAGERAIRSLDGEIALVVLDGGDDHLPGQRQETLLEPARDGDRPLHQGGDFVEQVAFDQRGASGCLSRLSDPRANPLTPPREIRHDLRAFQA